MPPTQFTNADNTLIGPVDGSNISFTFRPYPQTLRYDTQGARGSLVFRNGLLQREYVDYAAEPGCFVVTYPLQPSTALGDLGDILTARMYTDGAPSKYQSLDGGIQGNGTLFRLVPQSSEVFLLFRNGLLQTQGLDYTITALFYITVAVPLSDGDLLTAVTCIGGQACSIFDSSITGTVDGSNQYFTMPVAAFSEILLFRNGALQTEGFDYSRAGDNEIFFAATAIPQSGDVITAQVYTTGGPPQLTTVDYSLYYTPPASDWVFRNGLLQSDPVDYTELAPQPFRAAVAQAFQIQTTGVPLLFRDGILQAVGADYFLNGRNFTVIPVVADDEVLTAWMFARETARLDTVLGLYGVPNGSTSNFLLPWDLESVYIFRNGVLLIAGQDYTQYSRFIQLGANQIPAAGETLTAVGGIGGIQLNSLAGTITGTIDGVNDTFILVTAIVIDIMLFRSGALLTEGSDYVRDGLTITLSPEQIPDVNETLCAIIFTSNQPTQVTTVPLFTSTTLFNLSRPTTNLLLFRNGTLQSLGADYFLSGNQFTVAPALAAFETLTVRNYVGNPSRFDTPAGFVGGTDGVNLSFFIPHWIIDAGLRYDVFRNGIYMVAGFDYTTQGLYAVLDVTQTPGPGEVISLVAGLGGVQVSTYAGTITGTIDGVNTIFIVSVANVTGLMLFLNGSLLSAGDDYTLIANVIFFSDQQIPQTGWTLAAIAYTSDAPGQQSMADGSIVGFTAPVGITRTGSPQISGSQVEITFGSSPQVGDTLLVENWTPDFIAVDEPALNLGTRYTTLNGSISGMLDGVNNIFTINVPLLSNSATGATILITQVMLWWNGDFLTEGVDYTLQGSQITMTTHFFPSGSDILTAEVFDA